MASFFRITSLHVKCLVCSAFEARRLEVFAARSAEQDVGPDRYCSCESDYANRPIFCFAAYTWSTLSEKLKKKTYKLTTPLTCTCTCVYSTRCRQIRGGSFSIEAKYASIDVTKGVGGVTLKQLYLFFLTLHTTLSVQNTIC